MIKVDVLLDDGCCDAERSSRAITIISDKIRTNDSDFATVDLQDPTAHTYVRKETIESEKRTSGR